MTPYMKAPEAAEYLCFKSVEALYKAIPAQRIPFVRRGSRTLLFHRDRLDRWLEDQAKRNVLRLASR